MPILPAEIVWSLPTALPTMVSSGAKDGHRSDPSAGVPIRLGTGASTLAYTSPELATCSNHNSSNSEHSGIRVSCNHVLPTTILAL